MALNGKHILVTRSAEQAPALSHALAVLGAEPIVVPTIEIVAPQSYADLDQAIADIAQIDYLILTSVNAVRAFCGRLSAQKLDAAALHHVQVVAVGPKSAESLAMFGLRADLVPGNYRAEGIVSLLKDRVAGKKVLYPKAALARDLIPTRLRDAGADVIDPVAYSSAPPADAAERIKAALREGLDLLTFTASSTVENFARLLDENGLKQARAIPVASIGPLTTATAEKLGFYVTIEPEDSTLEELVGAIVRFYSEA